MDKRPFSAIFTSDALAIDSNPALACVPEHWPAKDRGGHTIRNGKALHDPCLYSCDSATRTCHQASTGIANESAAHACSHPYSAPTSSYLARICSAVGRAGAEGGKTRPAEAADVTSYKLQVTS